MTSRRTPQPAPSPPDIGKAMAAMARATAPLVEETLDAVERLRALNGPDCPHAWRLLENLEDTLRRNLERRLGA